MSLTGLLDKIPFWRDLPYPTKGALLRAIKAGLSVSVGILVAAATAGMLFPPTWSPFIVLTITMILQSVDKYLREAAIAREAGQETIPDSTEPDPAEVTITIDTP